MKRIVILHFALAAFASVAAEPGVVVDLSAGNLADFFPGENFDALEITDGSRDEVLGLSDSSSQLRDLKIKAATKYTLTLEARFEGDAESIEENSRFEHFNQPGHPNARLPSHEIRFFDTDGEQVGQPLLYSQPFKALRTYRDVFYSPHRAATARIKLTSGKGLRLSVTRLKLAETTDEGALNPNPEFQLGLSNYSGWKNIADGGELIEQDGKVILDTKYGSTGRMIPLTEPGTYGFSAIATPNGYNSIVIVRLYDAEGKELMRSGSRRYGPPTYFVPPKEAVSAAFLVYSCLLEEVRLFRAGDEEAILELQNK